MPDLNTLLDQLVTLAYESIDRVFLNALVSAVIQRRHPDAFQLRSGRN